MNWTLELAFHWPHNRLALGWEFIAADEEFSYSTFRLFLGILTITFNSQYNEEV